MTLATQLSSTTMKSLQNVWQPILKRFHLLTLFTARGEGVPLAFRIHCWIDFFSNSRNEYAHQITKLWALWISPKQVLTSYEYTCQNPHCQCLHKYCCACCPWKFCATWYECSSLWFRERSFVDQEKQISKNVILFFGDSVKNHFNSSFG